MAWTETPYRVSTQTCCITGPAASGKTEALIRRVVELLCAGVRTEEIGIFAATPDACDALQARLDAHLAAKLPDAPAPRVQTAFAYELELLGLPEARRATGCEPQVMLRFEENIFLEDMKTGGVQPKRLIEMLRFLYRSCCDLERMDYKWFYNDEEEQVLELLNQLQRSYRCYVRQMVAPSAYAFVRDFPAIRAKLGFKHVFADDYQTLSKASQCFLGLLAQESITAVGDPCARIACLEDFPAPDGLAQFAKENSGCVCVELHESFAARSVTEALNTLRADEAFDAGPAFPASNIKAGTMTLLSFATPREELDGVARTIATLVEEGLPPKAIAVAAPKPLWERNLAQALVRSGVPVARKHRLQINGDVRTLEASFDGRIVTLLKLKANPENRLAIRCWCGFGDYLANSALFCAMNKSGVHVTLETSAITSAAGEDALFGQQRDRIIAALDVARRLLPRLDGLHGEALLFAAARAIDGNRKPSQALLDAFGPLSDDMDAAALITALERRVNLSCFDPSVDGVRVGLTCDFLGLSPNVVYLCGMVNGFTPEQSYFDPTLVERDKRPSLLAVEAAKVYAAAGKAQERLYFSSFASASLADAEMLRLKIERIRLIKDQRMCEIHPSEAIRALTGVCFRD